MDEVIRKDSERISNLIYEIRGIQVMLDSDLAKLYECKNGTKTINLAVKRHINRFPERFMFQLTEDEYNHLRFQVETANNMSRALPYAFTEQGVAMLASILRTKVAEEVSIRIMDAFVAMRHYIGDNEFRLSNLETKIIEHDNSIKLLQQSFDKFEEKKKINEIYFNGQIYDAYSKILDIFKEAGKSLVIIDAYADNTLLDIIKRLKVDVKIITKPKNLLTIQDVNKYNMQYNNLKVYYDNTFHDRYFILDEKTIYHCGTSINRIGYKTFGVTLIGDVDVCKMLINKVNTIIKWICGCLNNKNEWILI